MARKPCQRSRNRKRKLLKHTEAIHVALKMSIRYGIPFYIYQCPGTQHWHVTKRPQGGNSGRN